MCNNYQPLTMKFYKLVLSLSCCFQTNLSTFSNIQNTRSVNFLFEEKIKTIFEENPWSSYGCLQQKLLHLGQCMKLAIRNSKTVLKNLKTLKEDLKKEKQARMKSNTLKSQNYIKGIKTTSKNFKNLISVANLFNLL